MKRKFTTVFAGNLVFFFLSSLITWVLGALGVTPYGRFVKTFFKGRTREEAQAFIDANRDLLAQMLPDAMRFSNLVIMPFSSLVTGIVAGLIISSAHKEGGVKRGIIWSLITIAPMAAFLVGKAKGAPEVLAYLPLMAAAVALGGAIGGRLGEKMAKKGPEIIEG